MNILKSGVMFSLFLVFLGQEKLIAQSYLHTRAGLGWGRYAPYNKEELDRNEHDFKLGVIVDAEYGRRFGLKGSDGRFSLLMGGRLHYNLRVLEGIYTKDRWEPDANINAHIFSAFLTPGASVRISNKFSIFLQVNVGPSFVLWYQDGEYMDSFWVFYVPIDVGGEYKLKDDLSLTFGINVQLPIYTGTAETLFLGIRKDF